MKRWNVRIPISGFVSINVEAQTEEAAKEAALTGDIPTSPDEWDIHEQIASGSVFYGMQNEIEIDEA